MMRILVCAVAILVSTGPVMAEENFLPLGTGYSTRVDSVPELASARDKLIAKSDVYETEIYRRALEERRRASYFRRFMSEMEHKGGNLSIDY